MIRTFFGTAALAALIGIAPAMAGHHGGGFGGGFGGHGGGFSHAGFSPSTHTSFRPSTHSFGPSSHRFGPSTHSRSLATHTSAMRPSSGLHHTVMRHSPSAHSSHHSGTPAGFTHGKASWKQNGGTPPGWSKGKKTGWGCTPGSSGCAPPGLSKP
jgi:hypothetical protein